MQTLAMYINTQKAIIKSQLSQSAWRSERSRLNIIEDEIGHWPLNTITQTQVLLWVNKPHRNRKKKNAPDKKWAPKTRNAYISLLRKILDKAVSDLIIKVSPLEEVTFYKVADSEPLPFTKKEIARILVDEDTCHQARLLFMVGVVTGLRISELIALGWEDVDFHKEVLYVRRAKPLADDIYKVPKTNASLRTIELNEHAIAALRELERYTGQKNQQRISVRQRDNFKVKKEGVRFVFYNSFTGKPFIDPKQFAKTFLTPMLKRLNIGHRGPSQIRHTFASQALTMGLPKEWVRLQLGHTNFEMIDRHYASWIEEDAADNKVQFAAQMNEAFSIDDSKSVAEKEADKASKAEIAPLPKESIFKRILTSIMRWRQPIQHV